MVPFKKRRLNCVWCILFLFVVEAIIWFAFLKVDHYSLKPNAVKKSIYPGDMAYTSGYNVDGNSFEMTDEDPQICFAFEPQAAASLVVELENPLVEDANVQLYYSYGGEGFIEKNQIKTVARKGDINVVLPLKNSSYQMLRLDFDSSFTLKDVSVSESHAKVNYQIDRRIIAQLLLTFLASVIVVLITYAIHEKRFADEDPIAYRSRRVISKNIPYESLTRKEITFLLLCFMIYFSWSMVFLKGNYGPDELMRYDVPLFIFNHNALPYGGEEELIHPYWGTSYGFSITLPYLLNVLFMKIVSVFSSNPNAIWVGARFTSVLSGLGIAYFSICITKRITKSPTRWLFIIPMSLTPQVIFLSSYVNLDSFSLFTVVFLIYIWIRGMQSNWDVRSCVWLGVGLGLCLISYQFAYPFVFGSFVLYCLWHITHHKKTNFKQFILHGLIVLGVIFLISGWYFIRNAYLYNGDFFALNASKPYAEMYAAAEQKPSLKHTYQVQGYSILGMLKATQWLRMTFYSTFYLLGGMNWLAPAGVYKCLWVGIVIGIIGCIYGFVKRKKSLNGDTRVILFSALISSVLVVGLSLYYSWASDYQPQGRYIITVLPLLFTITSYGIHQLLDIIKRDGVFLQKSVSALILLVFLILDVTAMFNCLSQAIY